MPKKPVVIPAVRCPNCGGLVIVGAETYHDCPGPKPMRGAVR